MSVFTSEGVKVYLNGDLVVTKDEISLSELKSIARASGVKKFTVRRDNEELTEADFPVREGILEIVPYYEAKQ